MVRPTTFRANEQTAVNNHYQKTFANMDPKILLGRAQREFDDFVARLKEFGVEVVVVEALPENDTPDAHFPNNWISFHRNGTVALFPMFAENRRLERRTDILDMLEKQGFEIGEVMDYSSAEQDGFFLEGTGSLVLDREHRKAYCALSARADEELLIEFSEDFEYTPVIFTANQAVGEAREPIYHTNVMMCVADRYSVICLDAIDDKKERKNVIRHLKGDGKEIIAISESQLYHFAGNMLQVKGSNGQAYLVMSSAAYESLSPEQLQRLESYNPIVHSSLDIIEACGGGSARCMMAEVFLPRKIIEKFQRS